MASPNGFATLAVMPTPETQSLNTTGLLAAMSADALAVGSILRTGFTVAMTVEQVELSRVFESIAAAVAVVPAGAGSNGLLTLCILKVRLIVDRNLTSGIDADDANKIVVCCFTVFPIFCCIC